MDRRIAKSINEYANIRAERQLDPEETLSIMANVPKGPDTFSG